MPVPVIGIAIGTAARLVAKKAAAKAAAKAAKTTKSLPKKPTVKNPPKPPMGKSTNVKNPPKPPTGSSIPKKPTHVSEIRTSSYKLPEVPKTIIKPNPTKNKGSFSGDLARYNWTGK